MARALKSIPQSLVPFRYRKPSLSERAQSATTSDVMAINNGLTEQKLDLLRILLSVSGVDHFAVHESNASSRNKAGRTCWPIRAKLECVFWPVYIVMSHERLRQRWTTKRPPAYTSLPTFEAAHILIQDLSHWFLFYVLLLPFEMVFAPETTFLPLGQKSTYVGARRLWDSQWQQAQLGVLQSHLLDLVTKTASSHCHVP